MSGEKILVIEDEENILEAIKYSLTREGYEVYGAIDGEKGLEMAQELRPDLVVLDVMLPRMDGFEVCRILRRDMSMPVFMLSARAEEIDKVVGLEIGADDYITKPFSMRELVARIRNSLRRISADSTNNLPTDSETYTAGDLEVDVIAHIAKLNGTELNMKPREFELLSLLISNKRRAFTRDQILEHLWGYDYIGDVRTVDVHVRWLREKIEILWKLLQNQARYSKQDPTLLLELEKRWNKHFLGKNEDTMESWDEIKIHLRKFCDSVEVREINSNNPGGDLDYQNHENGLKVIAIGGNKLSRGLTLEGLTVSYFGRPTRMYDSLLQMGRWFGFRPGYGDLVRLHLTANLLEWFSWLAHVERQIRLDIERYDRLNKSPLELAVRIQTHPELQVTSRLKRRSAVDIQVGWDGQTASTLYIDNDTTILEQNLTTTSSFVEMLQ